ncbi:MAG: hypothetical protein RML93_10445 [Anaerolineales bacterium]|nr:hypothetical protein [Anaerolineales bacterium]MCS7248862.1 hypothetical protein [Anaerolineales bacterium]MDW8162675.1 hypothetical protein [Anaerolineales bacterium]MDW8447695.1 hypothetical protein [Anaerolineales bacterium]
MNRKLSLRIASLLFFLFGMFELFGLVLLFIPRELLPAEFTPNNFETQSAFWGLISGIYGISRIIAGYAIFSNKKWGMALGLLLCLTTMIVAPTIVPFGIVDLILTMVILLSLLHARYGSEKILQDE